MAAASPSGYSSAAEDPLRVLDKDAVYLLIGDPGSLHDGDDVVEEVGYVPVGE
jgi:hypothetical protein